MGEGAQERISMSEQRRSRVTTVLSRSTSPLHRDGNGWENDPEEELFARATLLRVFLARDSNREK
jgi:hypothetical protein